MTLVLGIDPGVESPGYAVWCTEQQRHVYVSAERPDRRVDVFVVESGFIGRMGLKHMWGLGFRAAMQLSETYWRQWLKAPSGGWPAYTIRPDGAQGWRAALPLKPGSFQTYDGKDKAVIVNRLRHRYGLSPSEHTDDMVEACGIAEAAAAILARPKASQRKALKPVRFT